MISVFTIFVQSFNPEKNKYFSNATLTKTVHVGDGEDESSVGTPITWRAGKVGGKLLQSRIII